MLRKYTNFFLHNQKKELFMNDRFSDLQKDLYQLVRRGDALFFAMKDDLGMLSEEDKKIIKEGLELPNFFMEYESWYSEALRLIKQIIPERYDDFVNQYKNEKRKDITYATYTISDYLIGLKRGKGQSNIIVDTTAAIPKMHAQRAILAAAQRKFESSLFDIKEIVQSDIYDSELASARDLAKKGFARGGGTVAGVVLENHLSHVCSVHNLKTGKKSPTLADYNDLLKNNDIIDTSKWRFIQHLGDLRNLCSHKKDREPTIDDVLELVEGVEKTIKTVS